MCASMLLRAVSWHAILRARAAAMRGRGCVDAVQGTTIGVLMSATLPARLGEPSRALIVARRLGRARDRLPVVLGTLVSQTLLNVLALVILGAVDVHHRSGCSRAASRRCSGTRWRRSWCCCVVLVAPALLRSGLPSRSARVGRGSARRAAPSRACATG